jgi:hypothetical protein
MDKCCIFSFKIASATLLILLLATLIGYQVTAHSAGCGGYAQESFSAVKAQKRSPVYSQLAVECVVGFIFPHPTCVSTALRLLSLQLSSTIRASS